MASVRYFTDDAKAELYRLIDLANAQESEWSSPISLTLKEAGIGIYLRLEAINDYESAIAKYHKDILELKHTSKNDIDKIWEDVYGCESEHVIRIRELRERLLQIISEYSKLAEIIDCNRPGGFMLTGSTHDLVQVLFESFSTEKEYDRYIQGVLEDLKKSERFYLTDEQWDNMSQKERQSYLEEFYREVAKIMGLSDTVVFQFAEINERGVCGYKEGNIYIKINVENIMTLDRQIIMANIVHECRHAYQYEVVEDYTIRSDINKFFNNNPGFYGTYNGFSRGDLGPVKHPFTGNETAQMWRSHVYVDPKDDYIGYVSSTKEYDAWSFAGQLKDKETFFYYSNSQGFDNLRPTYRGSWD